MKRKTPNDDTAIKIKFKHARHNEYNVVPGQVFPKEIIIYIMNKLSVKDAFRMGITCTKFLYYFYRYYRFCDVYDYSNVIRGSIHDIGLVQYMLDNEHFDVKHKGECAMECACYYNWSDIIKLLLEKYNRKHCYTAYWWAIENGHLEIMKLAEGKHYLDCEEHKTAIVKASSNGHVNILEELLLFYDDDFFTFHEDPILLASVGGHVEAVKYLISHDKGQREDEIPCESG